MLAAAASSGPDAATWALVLLTGVGVFGIPSAGVALVRYLRKSGARDARQDDAAYVTLGDPTANPPVKGMVERFDDLSNKVETMSKQLTQNGGGSMRDVVESTQRSTEQTQKDVRAVSSKLDLHIGASEQAHAHIWTALDKKADK